MIKCSNVLTMEKLSNRKGYGNEVPVRFDDEGDKGGEAIQPPSPLSGSRERHRSSDNATLVPLRW